MTWPGTRASFGSMDGRKVLAEQMVGWLASSIGRAVEDSSIESRASFVRATCDDGCA